MGFHVLLGGVGVFRNVWILLKLEPFNTLVLLHFELYMSVLSSLSREKQYFTPVKSVLLKVLCEVSKWPAFNAFHHKTMKSLIIFIELE